MKANVWTTVNNGLDGNVWHCCQFVIKVCAKDSDQVYRSLESESGQIVLTKVTFAYSNESPNCSTTLPRAACGYSVVPIG